MHASPRLVMDRHIRSKIPGYCGQSDRHPQWDGEVPLRCQQELHTQGFLGVPTGKIPEDSNLASVEAMQWVHLLYLSIGHAIENISHSATKMCRSTIMHVPYSCSDCQRHIF
jgi:hypothetical protein